jgi:hypothetical protein
MKEKPGLQRGVSVPVKIESIIEDDEKSTEFVDNARNFLQTWIARLLRADGIAYADRSPVPGELVDIIPGERPQKILKILQL